MADAEVKHDYHLVNPSPWPVLGAWSAFLLTFGGVMSWHYDIEWIWPIGAALVAYTMFVWWRDVVKEAQGGDHKPVVALGLRYGMVMFIASEVMFFVAWFWAYFNAALYPTAEIGSVWPPEGIVTFDPWHLPFMNTVILLLSGTTVTWAHHAILHNDRKGLRQGLLCTVVLGAMFSGVQAFEYSHAAFGFTDGIYASTFFMATGFHGAHVLIGTIFLLVCLVRATRGHFTPKQHFGLEAAAWYWHFVDVVWLFLFVAIYVGSSAGTTGH